jgi:hypothetical protein
MPVTAPGTTLTVRIDSRHGHENRPNISKINSIFEQTVVF